MQEKILFLGDFLYDYEEVHKDIKEISKWIESNKFKVILNLEAPLKSNHPYPKWINLYQSEKFIKILKDLNVIAVNLANNHILDWSKEGMLNTIKKLEENNILYFGAGINLEEAEKPLILNFNNKKIGLLSYGWEEEMCISASDSRPGVNPLRKKKIIKQCQELKKKVDYLIINFHWGYELEIYPLPIHRKLIHELIDNNLVDYILGHHSHLIQAKESYKEIPIYYGLGNFYFGTERDYYEETKNKIARKFSKYGLGVSFDIKFKIEEHFFRYDYETKMTELYENYDLVDIGIVKIEEYNNFFKKNRTSIRKPSLYINPYGEELITRIKLKFNVIKEKIINLLINALKKLKLFEKIKRIIKK